jgi:hypothetical protein
MRAQLIILPIFVNIISFWNFKSYFKTSLHLASESGKLQIVEFFVSKGSDIHEFFDDLSSCFGKFLLILEHFITF